MEDALYQIRRTGDDEWLIGEPVARRMQRFRDGRLEALANGSSYLPLEEGAKVVLHVLPEAAFTGDATGDLLPAVARDYGLPPLYPAGHSGRYNFDGYLSFSTSSSGRYEAYAQLFRTGCIETVSCRLLADERRFIPSIAFEEALIRTTDHYLAFLASASLGPQVWLCLSLLHVKGFFMGVDRFRGAERSTIDRDHLVLDRAPVAIPHSDAPSVLRPLFDIIWQATGWARCMDYDERGQWAAR
jgi:hypothetical protein